MSVACFLIYALTMSIGSAMFGSVCMRGCGGHAPEMLQTSPTAVVYIFM